ncbi:TPA: hypothetical protein ACGOVI_001850 [Streptococcus suis]
MTTTSKVTTIKVSLSELEEKLASYTDYLNDPDDAGQVAKQVINGMILGVNIFTLGFEVGISVYAGGARAIKSCFQKAGLSKEQIEELFKLYYRILYIQILVIGKPGMSRKEFRKACDDYIRSLTYKQYQNLMKAPVNELAAYLMNVQLLSRLFSDDIQKLPLNKIEEELEISFNTKEKLDVFLKDANIEFTNGQYYDKTTNQAIQFVLD